MANLVNKVKEAFHSSQDTPSDERTGKLNLSAEERERLEAAGYGSEHHAQKRHLGAAEDIIQSQGHPPSYYLDNNPSGNTGLPGSFPQSQSENVGQHHKDGKEYVSPTGTHVGTTQATQQSVQHQPVSHSAEHGLASNVQNTTQPNVTPHQTESKHAGAETAAAVGAATIASKETKTGPNKLHKKEDPRGHVAFDEPPSHQAIHGGQPTTTTGTADTTTAVHHSMGGAHQASQGSQPTTTTRATDTTAAVLPSTTETHRSTAPASTGDLYEQQAARKYDANTDALQGNTTNYSYPTNTAATTAAAVGAGGLAATQIPERKHHDDYSKTESSNITSHSPPRGVGVYNTVTGAGSQDDPTHTHGSSTLGSSTRDQTFDSHPGLTTGTSAVPREAGDSSLSSGYGNTTTTKSNAPLPATLTGAGPGLNTTSDRTTTGASYTIPGPSAHTTAGTSTTTGGQDHFGPGHIGSKVVHTCTKCGEDNDITHYFKKESVYRLSQ